MSLKQFEQHKFYQMGYNAGFIDGQQKGLEVATQALAVSVRPMIISCDSKETVDSIMEKLKK